MNFNLKLQPFFLILCLMLLSCSTRNVINVEVKNPSDFNRLNDICEIDLVNNNVFSHLHPFAPLMLIVKDKSGNLLPSQVTYDGKLLFQPVLKAGETKQFEISLGDSVEYQPKVFGRLYPERKDDFAWENDRVGFRFYGAALKAIQAPTSALDLFYKRTPNMILDKWYVDDISGKASYHVDHGEGCDPYNVGQSLGAGGSGIYVDGELIRNENFESYELLDQGVLRITFKLKFPNIKLGDSLDIVDERLISLDAGSQLTKITQDYGKQDLEMATGIVRRVNAVDSVIVSKDNNYVIYQEPTDPKNGDIYIGLVFPDKFDSYKNDTTMLFTKTAKTEMIHSLALEKYKGKPITYYTGFGWNKYGFETIGDFEKYVSEFVYAQNKPFLITYIK